MVHDYFYYFSILISVCVYVCVCGVGYICCMNERVYREIYIGVKSITFWFSLQDYE